MKSYIQSIHIQNYKKEDTFCLFTCRILLAAVYYKNCDEPELNDVVPGTLGEEL